MERDLHHRLRRWHCACTGRADDLGVVSGVLSVVVLPHFDASKAELTCRSRLCDGGIRLLLLSRE